MCGLCAFVWLVFVSIAGNIERQHVARTVVAAEQLKVGQTTAEIVELLGQPLADYPPNTGYLGIFGIHPRQWCYGTRINDDRMIIPLAWINVNPLPLNFRWFSYSDGDLVIELDAKDRIAKIDRSRVMFQVDERYDRLLNMMYACQSIGESLISHSHSR